MTRHLLVTIEDIYIDEVTQRAAIELRGLVVPGDSGGPVFDGLGRLGGIVYATSRGRSDAAFALDATEVRAIIDSVQDGRVDVGPCV